MGYGSILRGAITITAPLTWEEYRNTPFVPGPNSADFVHLQMERATPVDGAPKPPKEGGPEFVAVALIGIEDQWSMYHLDKELAAFVALFQDGHTFGGYLIRIGEEQGDLERFTIKNGELVSEETRLVWADGTDVEYDDYAL